MSPFTVLGALGMVQQLRASINGWSHRVTQASIFGAVAVVFGLVALIFLAVTVFLALSDALPPVAAAAVVSLLFIVLAAVAGLLARHAIKRGRGGTGQAPVVAPVVTPDPMLTAMNALSSVDSRTLFALGAGVIGGLLATQLRARGERSGRRDAKD